MTSMKRTILVAGLSMLLLGGPVLAHGGHDDAFQENQAGTEAGEVKVSPEVQKAMGLTVEPVKEMVMSAGFAVNGRIEPIPGQTAEVRAPVAARVLRLGAARGQRVRTGQTLVVLDSPEIRQLAVDSERNQAQAHAALRQAQTQLQLAESTYQREKELLNLKISARKDFQVAQAERERARADLEAARAQLNLAGAALTSRLAQLGQRGITTRADGSLTLSSPIAGVVADQQVSASEAVEAGKTLYRVVDLERVWATAQIYEKDLSRVRVGQWLEVEVQAYPGRTFRGRIASIDPLVDPETRTLGVRTLLENPQGLLKPEMFATLRVVTGSGSSPVAVVPRTAVLDVEGEKLVYVQNGDAFVPTPVQLGRTSGNFIEVKDGVFPGDLVVTQRAFQLRAQSLKGGQATQASTSETSKADKAAPAGAEQSAPAPTNARQSPDWLWAVGSVALAAAGFFAGTQVSRRSTAGAKSLSEDLVQRPAPDSRPGRRGGP